MQNCAENSKMLQNVEYLTLPLIKMLNFDGISGLKISFKFQQKAMVYLIIIWLHANYSILRENTYEIWIKIVKRQKKKWNMG